MKLLILAQTPPPVHGAAIVNQAVKDLTSRKFGAQVNHVNTSASKTISGMQRGTFVKSLYSLSVFARCCFVAFSDKGKTTYINTAPSGASSIRDLILILIASYRSKSVFAHFHGQLPNSSVFLKKNLNKIIRKNVKYIFLDSSLIPKNLTDRGREIEILKNFSPGESLYKSLPPYLSQKKTVAFLANMLPSKGVVDFLEICASTLRDGYDFSVIIAGSWTLKYTESDYQSWLEKNSDIKERFIHFGAIDQEGKVAFFEQADIFLYPTKNDAFPLVLLEAMASRTAVIASNVGAIRNIISDDDLIFNPGDRPSPINTLKALLSTPKLLEEKQNTLRSRYYQNFSEDNFEKNLFRILGIPFQKQK